MFVFFFGQNEYFFTIVNFAVKQLFASQMIYDGNSTGDISRAEEQRIHNTRNRNRRDTSTIH